MKKITLIALCLLAVQNISAQRRDFPTASHVLFNFDNPIAFTERGIAFYIFPNGEFDFNTDATASDEYYRPRFAASQPDAVRIEHDSKGRVRRIGNVFLNYDSYDRVKRIGNVYMSYHRSALVQVGGLRLKYDMRGRLVDMIGSVKSAGQYAYSENYFYGNHHNGTIYENQYYYKSEKNTAPKKID